MKHKPDGLCFILGFVTNVTNPRDRSQEIAYAISRRGLSAKALRLGGWHEPVVHAKEWLPPFFYDFDAAFGGRKRRQDET